MFAYLCLHVRSINSNNIINRPTTTTTTRLLPLLLLQLVAYVAYKPISDLFLLVVHSHFESIKRVVGSSFLVAFTQHRLHLLSASTQVHQFTGEVHALLDQWEVFVLHTQRGGGGWRHRGMMKMRNDQWRWRNWPSSSVSVSACGVFVWCWDGFSWYSGCQETWTRKWWQRNDNITKQ